MPLAHRKIHITGAARPEYQGWLAEHEDSREFFTATVEALSQHYPEAQIYFKHEFQGACAETLKTFFDLKANARLVRHHRPILITDPDAVRSSLKKKINRSKLNRLKRCGDLQLKRVSNESDFNRYMGVVFAAFNISRAS